MIIDTLEETIKISATLETGSLPSARRNLEAVFFDLDDSLVLSFMLLTQSLTKLFRYACIVSSSTLKP
jgi:hypothetical protein